MRLSRTLAIATYSALLFVLSGCGWLIGKDGVIKDRREEYREAKTVEPLQLPDGADNSTIRELYHIPGAGQALVFETDEFKVPRPDIQTTFAPKELKAYKSDNEYWIVLDGAPDEVWGRVRRFWEVNDIELASEVPYRGLMETAWLKRNNEGYITRDKFQVAVEYGLQKGVSEVHIKHLGYDYETAEIPAQELDWSQAEAGDKLALAMTQELSSFLIRTEADAAPASLLAQKFVGQPKSSLSVNSSGKWIIDMDLSYGRAWNAMGKAIDAAGFELKDKNRDSGLYYLVVTTGEKEAEEGGFFSFLSFGDNDDEAMTHSVTIKVKSASESTAGKVQAFISEHEESLTAPLRKDVLKRIKSQLI